MLQWPDATMYEGLAHVAAAREDAVALRFEGETTTYGELFDEARALAGGLAELGIGADDFVAVWLSNRPEWIKAQLAASYLGAAVVAVNTRYRTHELEYMLNDSGCTALLTEESFLGNDYLEMLADVTPEVREQEPDSFHSEAVPTLDHVIALEDQAGVPAARAYDDVEAMGEAADLPDPATDPTRPVTVFYTSGTTSDPKGCLQSNRSLLNHSHQAGVHVGLDQEDVTLGAVPFCGVWGFNLMLGTLAHGAELVVQTHFQASASVRLVDDHDVTFLPAMATMARRMMHDDAFEPGVADSIEKGIVGFLSIGFDEELFEEIEATLGFPVVQPYGLSEANSMVFVGDPDDPMAQRKKVGGPMIHPDEEATVVDPETGEDLPLGEKGELCLRGFNVMNEYLGKPEKTAEAIDDDGWLHTGDLVLRDEQEYLYFHSRLDDALRVRGFLVTPRDIEAILDEHPGVELSQVVGADHPRHGQVPVAFVKRADPDLTAAELYDYLDDHVADYKVPEAIEFVSEFPRTEGPHGAKIQKNRLRERVEDRYV
ncbi:MAG: class I adenylate-forming enzyme family protein [Haloarculaceae archaeon]